MTNFQSELRAQAAAVLLAEERILHGWEEHPNAVTLFFPETNEGGFRVGVEARETGLVLLAGRMHVPFDDDESPADQVREVLGLARDLLSAGMRLRELRFLGVPYRWYLESKEQGAWTVEHEMGLLLWIPSLLASTAIYQNHQLPPRGAV
jgi:hypothetical protein